MKTTWRVFQMLTASVGEYDLKTQVTPHGIFREIVILACELRGLRNCRFRDC